MKNTLAIILFSAITLMGCNSNKKSKETPAPELSNTTQIVNTTWELTKLGGQTIDQNNVEGRKIQFSLNSSEKRASGYSGCNQFNGLYTLEEGNRIKFSQMASTKRACLDAKINETEVLKVFELTDNYTINGNTLNLNVGRRAPLAAFKAVSPE